MKEIILNNNEIAKVKDTFENNFKTYDDDSGCLCCDFICDISDSKSIIVNCHCRRSSNCPDGKQWNFDEIIVYGQKMISNKDDSYSILELPNNENEEEVKVLGILNRKQSLEIYKILNKKIMEEFTGYNRDGLYPEEIEIVKEIEKFDDNQRTKCEYIKNTINFLDKEDQLKILKSLF